MVFFRQNIWYCVAATVILLNLIGNMTIFCKKSNIDLLTTSQGLGGGVGGSGGKIFVTVLQLSYFF